MPADQEARQHQLDDLLLTDDGFTDLAADAFRERAYLLDVHR